MTRLEKITPWGGHQWYVAQTGSTMDEARTLEGLGEPSGTVVRADHQSAGVGRFATRNWTSKPGESLLFTGYWSLSTLGNPEFAPSLTLGWGVCLWLEGLVGASVRVSMKWPNDVYLDDQKLAGILVRTRVGASGRGSLHAGIGINLGQKSFSGDYRTPPVSLAQVGVSLEPAAALDALLPYLARVLAEKSPGPSCESRLWRLGQDVDLRLPGSSEPRTGRVLGLGSEGQLRWETSEGETLVSSGE